MRTVVIAWMLLVAGLMCGCETSHSRVVSSGGESAAMPPMLLTLTVLPVKLPEEIHGRTTPEDIERYRRDWPMAAARVVAHAVTEETDERIRAVPAQEKPQAGYYFTIEVTYLDVGDLEARATGIFGGKQEGWSLVLARGRLIDASTGKLAAELEFTESSGQPFPQRFENDMYNLGEELAGWLVGRRE